jgi:hypothetical protein
MIRDKYKDYENLIEAICTVKKNSDEYAKIEPVCKSIFCNNIITNPNICSPDVIDTGSSENESQNNIISMLKIMIRIVLMLLLIASINFFHGRNGDISIEEIFKQKEIITDKSIEALKKILKTYLNKDFDKTKKDLENKELFDGKPPSFLKQIINKTINKTKEIANNAIATAKEDTDNDLNIFDKKEKYRLLE